MDREIVIKIPEEIYNMVVNTGTFGCYRFNSTKAIREGTPLPEGHGELIDRKALINDGFEKGFCDWYDEIKYAQTIIEADKGEE